LQSIKARTANGLPVDVDVEISDDANAYADAVRFQQVLKALLDNAVKFHRDGGHVHVRAVHTDDTRVRIDVIDDGIGIPGDALPHVFDRFYQVDNTATRAYGGTGMGLALVNRLVEAHGAEVEVESHPGRGSRFTLFWPATAAAAGGELAQGYGPELEVSAATKASAEVASPQAAAAGGGVNNSAEV
jgi:signal transduction histidine kinase